MDFDRYNRDTAFGYSEDENGDVTLTIYLGGDNVKDFSIITGGAADIIRLKQLIKGAKLEEDHVANAMEKAERAERMLGNAGIKVWLTKDAELLEESIDESLSQVDEGLELIMDSTAIAKKLTDDTRLKRINVVAYSHYGYDNNYTRAHEETEHIIESMIALMKRKASKVKGDFEIILESMVKQGEGDRPGIIADPEEQIFGAYYSYAVRSGELCISEINCDDFKEDLMRCPRCGAVLSYDYIKEELSLIAERGIRCPGCGVIISAGQLRRGLLHGEYFFRKRDLMPVYISADDISCVSFLGDDCSENRVEKYLKQAIDEKKQNCVAALLNYKEKHFKRQDFLDIFEMEDDELFGSDDVKESREQAADKSDTIEISEDGELILGSYAGHPLEWKVLSIVDGEAFIITKECIDSFKFNETYARTAWDESTMRSRLNTVFLNDCFSEAERLIILDTPLPNPDNHFSRARGGKDTVDKVFLLNIDEAEFYFDDRFLRQGKAANEAIAKRAYVAGTGFAAWWLRSPGNDEFHTANVDYYGIAYYIGFMNNYTGCCVRPAMWIRL